MAQLRLLTAEDIASWPDDYELNDGVPRSIAAAPLAPAVAANAAVALWNHVRPARLGVVFGADASFRLSRDPDTVFLPDAAFVRAERIRSRDDLAYPFEGTPDLAVEVRSPSDGAAKLDRKMHRYLAAGTTLGWAIDPVARTVIVYCPDAPRVMLTDRDALAGNDVLPGLRTVVADLFWVGEFQP